MQGHPHTLYVFDIDDTLLRTNAKVKVYQHGKLIKRLSTRQFAGYAAHTDDCFDFSEFRCSIKFKKGAKPIDNLLDKVMALSKTLHPKSKIIFNTARADMTDKEVFLDTFRDFGIPIDTIHVHRAGNLQMPESTGEKKLVYIRHYLEKTKQIKRVEMFDVSQHNLEAFKTLKTEYPSILFKAWHVTKMGNILEY